ncbi:MAG: hypothetical protein EOP88_08635 [Verrucomicrobiaceae bacterium]|nr:MAG: hypothetical protein EOP88_08635 [Verrucomicrobiaceae bacterium]
MKTLLLSALAAVSMIATGVAGTIPKNSKVKLELVSITKIDNGEIKPSMKPFKGAPTALKVGKTYDFKMGGKGKLTGPGGVNIANVTDSRLKALHLEYLKVAGVSNFYLDYKASGAGNKNIFVEFGAAFQANNKGKPVAVTLTYLDIKAYPNFSNKSITYVFEVVEQ